MKMSKCAVYECSLSSTATLMTCTFSMFLLPNVENFGKILNLANYKKVALFPFKSDETSFPKL